MQVSCPNCSNVPESFESLLKCHSCLHDICSACASICKRCGTVYCGTCPIDCGRPFTSLCAGCHEKCPECYEYISHCADCQMFFCGCVKMFHCNTCDSQVCNRHAERRRCGQCRARIHHENEIFFCSCDNASIPLCKECTRECAGCLRKSCQDRLNECVFQDGCLKGLCDDCCESCDSCGVVVCKRHSVLNVDSGKTLCPNCA